MVITHIKLSMGSNEFFLDGIKSTSPFCISSYNQSNVSSPEIIIVLK